jgi:hypothetical protein
MARQYAGYRILARAKGGNTVRVAAYNMEGSLVDERTGQRFTFRARDTLVHHEMLLPEGADPAFQDPAKLWSAAELAERNRNAQVGSAMVLSLPDDPEISPAERIEMAREFVQRQFVSKGLAAQIDVHDPPLKAGAWYGNPHAHVLVTARTVGADGFGHYRYRDPEFVFQASKRGKFLAEGPNWSQRWADFQNHWFDEHGKEIKVDPLLPYGAVRVGPKRFQQPSSKRVQARGKIRDLNRQVARNPQATFDYLREYDRLNDRDVERFLAKFIRDPAERAELRDEVFRLRSAAPGEHLAARRDDLSERAWADRVQSGLRELTIEDVARQLSPKFQQLDDSRQELRLDIGKREWARTRRRDDIAESEKRVEQRQEEIGVARRALHATGVFPDLPTQVLERWGRGSARGYDKLGIKLKALTDRLKRVDRLAAEEFEKVRAAAVAELGRRQHLAGEARTELEQMDAAVKQTRRQRQRAGLGV